MGAAATVAMVVGVVSAPASPLPPPPTAPAATTTASTASAAIAGIQRPIGADEPFFRAPLFRPPPFGAGGRREIGRVLSLCPVERAETARRFDGPPPDDVCRRGGRGGWDGVIRKKRHSAASRTTLAIAPRADRHDACDLHDNLVTSSRNRQTTGVMSSNSRRSSRISRRILMMMAGLLSVETPLVRGK